MTMDQLKATPSKMNRAKVKTTTEADIRRHMIEDGEAPSAKLRVREIISPADIRRRLGMSQPEFAETLGIPVATLRNWEQNRVIMDPVTIALMRILAHEPKTAPKSASAHRGLIAVWVGWRRGFRRIG
jgi:putative transcriptional regulator